jgi:hypothetical protein
MTEPMPTPILCDFMLIIVIKSYLLKVFFCQNLTFMAELKLLVLRFVIMQLMGIEIVL